MIATASTCGPRFSIAIAKLLNEESGGTFAVIGIRDKIDNQRLHAKQYGGTSLIYSFWLTCPDSILDIPTGATHHNTRTGTVLVIDSQVTPAGLRSSAG